jgi:hypothetical protein
MGLLLNGTTQALTVASGAVTAAPLTLSCWANAPVLGAQYYIFDISSTIDDSLFALGGGATNFDNEVETATGSVDTGATSTLTPLVNTLYHICSVFTSITSRTIYINGGNTATDTTSCTPTAGSLNGTVLGALYPGSAVLDHFFNANMYFPAIWNTALTAADVLSLSQGISPRKIQPSHLVRYARLTGHNSPEPDMINSTGWTVVAAPTQVANIRMYFP